MRSWLPVPPTLPGFPAITALASAPEDKPAAHARRGQRLARRARSPYVLLHRAGARPAGAWLGAPQELLAATPVLAAVSPATAGNDPAPSLSLNPGAVLLRRTALLGSGGLAPRLAGPPAGLDLAWRLWAMGHRVADLSGNGAVAAVQQPCSAYEATWSWLQILVRNCEAESLARALSAAVLRLMAAAGEAAERAAVVQAWPAVPPAASASIQNVPTLRHDPGALAEPFHRTGRDVGEMLVILHDVTQLLPLLFRERKKVQAARRVSDTEIGSLLGRPPLAIVEEQLVPLGLPSLPAEAGAW